MDLELNTLKIVDHKFKREIKFLTATDKNVAVGDYYGNVTVFNKDYNLVLVSSLGSALLLFRLIKIKILSRQ